MDVVTPAVLARKVDIREADRVCTLITRSLGKVSALARSARRSRKRYGGALSLFVIGEATLAAPRRGDLRALQRFDSREDLTAAIGADIVKVAHGSYILELARELWPPEQVDPGSYDLLCAALRALAAAPEPCPPLLRAFELQILERMGLAPGLDACVCCGGPAAPPLTFDVGQGGVVCARCPSAGEPLAPETLAYLRRAAAVALGAAAGLAPERPAARQARGLLLRVIHHHLGKTLRSLEFLRGMSRGGQGGGAAGPAGGPPATR